MDAKGRESEPICIDDEVPFDIPKGWEWARVSSIGELLRGSGIKRTEITDTGLPCVRYGELYTTYDLDIDSVASHVPGDLFDQSQHIADGDILMTLTGENKIDIGRAVYNASGREVAYGGDLLALKGHSQDPMFLALCLNSPYVGSQRTALSTGNIIVHLSGDKIGKMLIAIPPLAEQRRIAERVSELMPLVEEYGKLEDEREALDAALPGRLRKSVLQMAVEGKLLPQDPGDEPASVLLDRIREERARLIKDKKLKAPKGGESVIYLGSDGRRYEKRVDAKGRESEPICIDDEVPFDIPKGWEWARLESVLFNRDAERIPVSVAEREKLEKRYDYYGASGVIDKVDKYLFDKPLLLIGEDGANLLARTKPIAFMARGQYWVNNHAHVLDGISEAFLEYIALFMNSISLAPYVTGTAQPKMNQAKMNSILIPLPPKEEQARILKQVSRLSTFITNR